MSQQRRAQLIDLIDLASPHELRAALRAVIAETGDAQSALLDVTSHGIDGSRSSAAVDSEFAARRDMGEDLDGVIHAALLAKAQDIPVST